MSYLVANLPPVDCFIRKEYLYDLTKDDNGKLIGEGEFEPCYWVSAKSVKCQALLIEALVIQYGALYDKLPISAFVWKNDLEEFLPLDYLQLWDCFSYNITVIEKATLRHARCKVFMKNKKIYEGQYLFTIDSCHSDPGELNVTLSETPNEHKSFNIIKLDNGQFAAQPNNRIIWYEQSLIPSEPKKPDFKTSTKLFVCENYSKWSVTTADEYFYELDSEIIVEN